MGWVGKTFVWTNEEIEFLKKNYSITKNKDLAERLKTNVGIISAKASSLGLEKPNPDLRHQYYKAIKRNQDDNDELNEEIGALRKTIESIGKESFIEKYFMVVWGGIIGGSIVYIASLNEIRLLFRFGIILVIVFFGFVVKILIKYLKKS